MAFEISIYGEHNIPDPVFKSSLEFRFKTEDGKDLSKTFYFCDDMEFKMKDVLEAAKDMWKEYEKEQEKCSKQEQ